MCSNTIAEFLYDDSIPYETKLYFSVFTQTSMSLSGNVFLFAENFGTGINFETVWLKIDNYSVGICLLFCFITAVVYLILAIYLD